MLSWMLYSIVVSLLMGLAALALERSAQIRRRPARWLWGACMVASLAILFIPSAWQRGQCDTDEEHRARRRPIINSASCSEESPETDCTAMSPLTRSVKGIVSVGLNATTLVNAR